MKESLLNTEVLEPEAKAESTEKFEDLFSQSKSCETYIWGKQINFDFLFNVYVKGRDQEYIEEQIRTRKLWVEMMKDGEAFTKFVEDKIRSYLNTGDNRAVYETLEMYKSLGRPDVAFLKELLTHTTVCDDSDGSVIGVALDILNERGGQESIDALVIIIGEYISGAIKTGSLGSDRSGRNISYAVGALKTLAGDETLDILSALAESQQSFKSWFEANKSGLTSKSYAYHLLPFGTGGNTSNKSIPEVLDTSVEEARIKMMEEEKLKPPAQGFGNLGDGDDNGWLPLDDNSPDKNRESAKPTESNDSIFTEPWFNEQARSWENGTAINFYGRYGTSIEKDRLVEISNDNYLPVLNALSAKVASADPLEYFRFIGNTANKELIETSVPLALTGEGATENAYKMASLAYARAVYQALGDGTFERSVSELRIAREYIMGQPAFSEKGSTGFLNQLCHELKELESEFQARLQDKISDNNKDVKGGRPALPKSADPFLMYNSKLKKMREIPGFETLLKEKVRRWLALDIQNNFKAINLGSADSEVLPVAGPSFVRFKEIMDQIPENINMYKIVNTRDVPFYWEANDRMAEFNIDKCVVFGRDGRYFFTALKALDFGLDKKDLTYLVVTRKMKDGASQAAITQYLKEHGATLDHTYIDTGFEGSIPELAINYIANEAGVSLSESDIDKRIKLLSSSNLNRKELARRRGSSGIVGEIEDYRAHKIESPSRLTLKNGKLEPFEVPTSVREQLLAWTVEHAVMRNFAPKFDGDKEVKNAQLSSL